jgi:hypothetical protein
MKLAVVSIHAVPIGVMQRPNNAGLADTRENDDMMLTDEQFEALQRLQERLLDDALERGLAPALSDESVAAIDARFALLARIDAVVGASYGDGEAAAEDDALAADDDDADLDEDGLHDDDDEPLRVARRLAAD